ncbi:MAG: FtsK/SpoIIIE domain-containing protein [Actinomycetota bacterium]
MQLSIEITGYPRRDVTVTGLDNGPDGGQPGTPAGELTIAGLLARVGIAPPARVILDGRVRRLDDRLRSVPLRDGSRLTDREEPQPEAVWISRIAGPDAGSRRPLPPGSYDIGEAAGDRDRVGRPWFRLTVSPTSTVTVTPLATGVSVDDAPFGDPTGGTVVRTPGAIYRIAKEVDGGRSPAPTGAIPVARSPRPAAPVRHPAVPVPEPPVLPQPPQPLSWLILLAPIPLGIVLAWLINPFFLVFTLMSPIMTLARWVDGRRRLRRGRIEAAKESAERLARFAEDLGAVIDEEGRLRNADFVDLARLDDRVRSGGAGLWAVRPGHDDHLRVNVGLGPIRWLPELPGRSRLDGVDRVAATTGRLPAAPVPVDLGSSGAIGIVGDPERARQVAAAVLVQLAVDHGPADLSVAALLDGRATAYWDWLKWLPHLYDTAGRPTVAGEEGPLMTTIAPPSPTGRGRVTTTEESGPTPVVVVDHAQLLGSGLPAISAVVNRGAAVAVVIADRTDRLPACCGTVVQVDRSARATVTDVASGQRVDGVVALAPATATVTGIARGLARYVDPEAADGAGSLPTGCRLTELLDAPPTADGLVRSWARPRTGLVARLGAGAEGTFGIDLVADGPHALVAGTTGAGKSELLRTMVAAMAVEHPPTEVTFVLVDFKGGGAFDACADLPHTVGVVTDLDEHLAARALRCLRAELTHRETALRDAGVSDLRDYPRPDRVAGIDPLPRLVIVVDEFATLAAELPEFLASLVDVAQRGRSLGIHMVLATQRPSGVVDAKIRANTNLRIALRVQDDMDSVDVIDTGVAATIHRSQPGRAFARLGAGELAPFQAALVSGPIVQAGAATVGIEPFTLGPRDDHDDATDRPSPAAPAVSDGSGESELARITAAAIAAADAAGFDRPRVPWPPALPEIIDLGRLLATANRPWRIPIGLVDEPDQQRQRTFHWDAAADGNLLLYGVDAAATAGAVTTICHAVARTHDPAAAHLYVVDFAGSAATVEDLPHVGAYLTAHDDERIDRLLDLVDRELDARRTRQQASRVPTLGPDDVPLFAVCITNLSGLLEHLDERGDLDGIGRLVTLVRDGPSLGMVLVATGSSDRAIPIKLAGLIEAKLVLRLADPTGYGSFGLRPKDVPDLGPGRAIDARSGLEVLLSTVPTPAGATGGESQPVPGPNAPATLITRPAAWAHPLRTLQTTIHLADLDEPSTIDGDRWRLVIGTRHDTLATAHLDLRAGIHAVVTGPPSSGRTTALYTIAAAARAAEPELAIGGLGIGDIGRPIGDPAALTELAEGGGLLLVDDLEHLAPDMTTALEAVLARPPTGVRVVVAGRPETFKSMQPIVRHLTAGRTGILLMPAADAGEVFRLRVRPPDRQVPGRGHIVTAGTATLVQLALDGEPAGPWYGSGRNDDFELRSAAPDEAPLPVSGPRGPR